MPLSGLLLCFSGVTLLLVIGLTLVMRRRLPPSRRDRRPDARTGVRAMPVPTKEE